jgi:hypothetical protein
MLEGILHVGLLFGLVAGNDARGEQTTDQERGENRQMGLVHECL